MRPRTARKVQECQAQGSRESKREAKETRKSAFGAYLHDECICKQLAMAFLKFPPGEFNGLLHYWLDYIKDPGREIERRRAARVDGRDPRAWKEKQRQRNLKERVQALRDQIRQMKHLDANAHYGQIPEQLRHMYERWQRGEIQKDLERLERLHGYSRDNQPERFPEAAAKRIMAMNAETAITSGSIRQ